MAIFVVIADEDNPVLAAEIASKYPNNHYEINDRTWLVAADALSKTVSDNIGVTPDGKFGSGVIFAIDGYYGWHNKDTWEWITLKS